MNHASRPQADGDDGETTPDMDGSLEPMNSIEQDAAIREQRQRIDLLEHQVRSLQQWAERDLPPGVTMDWLRSPDAP